MQKVKDRGVFTKSVLVLLYLVALFVYTIGNATIDENSMVVGEAVLIDVAYGWPLACIVLTTDIEIGYGGSLLELWHNHERLTVDIFSASCNLLALFLIGVSIGVGFTGAAKVTSMRLTIPVMLGAVLWAAFELSTRWSSMFSNSTVSDSMSVDVVLSFYASRIVVFGNFIAICG